MNTCVRSNPYDPCKTHWVSSDLSQKMRRQKPNRCTLGLCEMHAIVFGIQVMPTLLLHAISVVSGCAEFIFGMFQRSYIKCPVCPSMHRFLPLRFNTCMCITNFQRKKTECKLNLPSPSENSMKPVKNRVRCFAKLFEVARLVTMASPSAKLSLTRK